MPDEPEQALITRHHEPSGFRQTGLLLRRAAALRRIQSLRTDHRNSGLMSQRYFSVALTATISPKNILWKSFSGYQVDAAFSSMKHSGFSQSE